MLLVSVAALRTGALPRRLNQLGMLTAAAGLVTVVPGLSDVGLVFGLGLIGWFAWVGVTLLPRGPLTGRRPEALKIRRWPLRFPGRFLSDEHPS